MTVRTFIALELSDGLKEGILTLNEELRKRGVRASWARRPALHLTLKFLGDVEESELPEVVAAVEPAIEPGQTRVGQPESSPPSAP